MEILLGPSLLRGHEMARHRLHLNKGLRLQNRKCLLQASDLRLTPALDLLVRLRLRDALLLELFPVLRHRRVLSFEARAAPTSPPSLFVSLFAPRGHRVDAA